MILETAILNVKLGLKEQFEADFSTEMRRFNDKSKLTRNKEGSAYRYFVPKA